MLSRESVGVRNEDKKFRTDLVSLDETDTIDVPWGNWQRQEEERFLSLHSANNRC